MVLTVLPAVNIFAGRDTSIAVNQPLQLNAVDNNNAGFINYSWSPSFGLNNTIIKDPVAILNRDITYTVTATTAEGCTAKDDISVKVFIGPEIYVPNAFTPNNDGLNDVFIVKGDNVATVHMLIFDRWGEKVFESENADFNWDGTYRGKELNSGVFVYYLKATCFSNNEIIRKGNITIVK